MDVKFFVVGNDRRFILYFIKNVLNMSSFEEVVDWFVLSKNIKWDRVNGVNKHFYTFIKGQGIDVDPQFTLNGDGEMFEKDSWSKRVCPGCALFHKHSVRSLKRCPKRFCGGMECLKADNVMWPFRNRRCACNAHHNMEKLKRKMKLSTIRKILLFQWI